MSVPDKKDGKKPRKSLWATAVLWGAVLAAGCTAGSFAGTGEETAAAGPTGTAGTAVSTETIAAEDGYSGQMDKDRALELALQNAGVPETDAYNIKVESDRENDISIYQVEFETDYGDYDFEIAVTGGAIVGADYEVDEQWLDALGGNPVDMDGARAVVQSKVPGSSAEEIQLWEENRDGRECYEGELYFGSMKYEFEIDSQTGIIFDWNADFRE